MLKLVRTRLIAAFLLAVLAATQSNAAFAGTLEKGISAFKAKDYGIATAILKPLAEQGDAVAQQYFGETLFAANETEKSRPGFRRHWSDEGAAWLKRAAEQGNLDAEYKLGTLSFRMVLNDKPKLSKEAKLVQYKKAVTHYRRGVEKDHLPSIQALGGMYRYGYGVEQDLPEAARLFERSVGGELVSARQSMFNLCSIYGHGPEGFQNLVIAHKWCTLAFEKGLKPVMWDLKEFEQKMNPGQIAEAQRLAREWQAKQ